MKRFAAILVVLMACCFSANALSLALDSIKEWGKFPRFVVNTYRWGCEFFNGYDTLYVTGTGHPFNIKVKTESWTDYYNLKFENGTRLDMISTPSTSLGFYLTYLAVSGGYDVNLSKYFTGNDQVRKRFNFQFNCMLFGAELYFISNDVGTRINSLTPRHAPTIHPKHLDFYGIKNSEWGIDVSYYIKHKRYSAAAAFNFSRIQIKSGGSFFVGFNYNRLNYHFNFGELPEDLLQHIPYKIQEQEEPYTYAINTSNFLLKGGYGYNWVFKPKWVLGVSESPMIGLTKSYIPLYNNKTTRFGAVSITKLSLVFNSGNWFAGAMGTAHIGLGRDSERSLISAYLTMEISAGWRFSLW